jgi:hypothetical protein
MAGTATLALHDSARLSLNDKVSLYGSKMPHNNGMDEADICRQLSQSFDERSEALENLLGIVRRNGGRLPFNNKKRIFTGVALALNDSNWDVRHQCTSFIREAIPQLNSELDDCMAVVLPQLVSNIGDGKLTVRRDAIHTVHMYMQHSENMPQIFRALILHGIENPDSRTRREIITGLPLLLTEEFVAEDFSEIVQALGKRLIDSAAMDQGSQQLLLTCIDKIHVLVGEETFESYIDQLTLPVRQYYTKLVSQRDHNDGDFSDLDDDPIPVAPKVYVPAEKLAFGFISSDIMAQITDEGDVHNQLEGLDNLKQLFAKNDSTISSDADHSGFVMFLVNLLDDSNTNYKIVSSTLDVIGLLVGKLGNGIMPYLKTIMDALNKRMADNKVVIKPAIMKVLMKLMQALTAKNVLKHLLPNLQSKSHRARQETLNVIIAALLTFSSYDFDMNALCNEVTLTLMDTKKSVRLASLECCAALASSMGSKKQLLNVVDNYGNDELSAAVQARLLRRLQPKLTPESLVEYTMPTMPGRNGGLQGAGADVDWIQDAAGGLSSGGQRTPITAHAEVEVGARSLPPVPSEGTTPRRHVSSGKGKMKLPWNDESTNGDRPHVSSRM